jgi:hypothetical protein
MKKIIFLFILSFFACPIFVLAEQIDINSATLSQLDEIVHVGAKTAQKIIDDRPYDSVQSLNKVKGIGDGKYLQDIINQGWACVNCQTTITQNTPAPALAQTPTTTPTVATDEQTKTDSPIIYPTGVIINELLPNPTGADETDEWIELYNINSFNVDLSGWQIQDTAGTIVTYTIAQDVQILANGFLVLKRPDTKIMLNNDQDGLNLLTPDKKVVNSVSFVTAPLGQSYNKTSGSWQWSLTPTPGNKNIITQNKTTKVAKTLSKTKNSVTNDGVAIGLADISQNISSNQEFSKIINPWFLFFSALATAVTLALIILFIKLKIRGVKQN